MNRDEIMQRWLSLGEQTQNAIAGNFFPELVTEDTPEPILRSIDRAIEDRIGDGGKDGGQ